MLPTQHRLKKDKDFDLVFKKGTSFTNDCIFLKVNKNDLEVSRFGFIVSKKISKKASARNRIKRILREIIRKRIEEIKNGFDIIFIVKIGTGVLNQDYSDLEKEIEYLLKKSKLV